MAFFKNLFSSAETKRRKSHILNLLSVAAADGEISEREIAFLAHVAERLYMPRKEFIDVLENPNDVVFYPPDSDRERIDQLDDLVRMMLSDGDIDQNEIFRCKAFALKLGFKPQIIDALVKHVVEGAMHHWAKEVLFAKVAQLIRSA